MGTEGSGGEDRKKKKNFRINGGKISQTWIEADV